MKKKSQSKESQYLVEGLLLKKITMSSQFMNTLSSPKLCLCHEPTMEITKHCNIVSHLSNRGISYHNKEHFLVRKLHLMMLCRPKNIQNVILNQNVGVRSVHNSSTSNLFGSGDKMLKIEKLSEKETDSQEEYALKSETKSAKGSHHPRKRQGSSEDIKAEHNKTTDGILNGEESDEITSKGMCCHGSPSTCIRYVCKCPWKKGTWSLIINVLSDKIKA